jgi:peptidyl-prolyl cis-trans isomerase C
VATYDEVVARVNGEEITVHQLNERAAQIGLAAEGDPGAVRRQLLDSLIDERLLVQKAIARGLDKDPATRNAIERARMQLLAEAAIGSSGYPDVNEKEARAFYLANPDLFGARKIYTFRRFLLDSGKLDGPVKAKLDQARTGAEVAGTLKAAGLSYTQMTELRTAESLQASILAQAARMKSGDILLFSEGSRTTLLQLVGSVAEPVSLETAIPSILEYLAHARHQQKADQLVKDLRRKAKVEYVTQTAKSSIPTALADGKPVRGEPPLKKPLQSQPITVMR